MPLLDEAKDLTITGSENYNILLAKPGVTMKQAQSDIDVIAARLAWRSTATVVHHQRGSPP